MSRLARGHLRVLVWARAAFAPPAVSFFRCRSESHRRPIRECDFTCAENTGCGILCRPSRDGNLRTRLELRLEIHADPRESIRWKSLEAPSTPSSFGTRHIHDKHDMGIDDADFRNDTGQTFQSRTVVVWRKRMVRTCRQGDRQHQNHQPDSSH